MWLVTSSVTQTVTEDTNEERGPPSFIRFDLNPPGHPNEEHGVRSHLHPGTDDYSVPSAVFDPIEILDLFLFGMVPRDPDRRRR